MVEIYCEMLLARFGLIEQMKFALLLLLLFSSNIQFICHFVLILIVFQERKKEQKRILIFNKFRQCDPSLIEASSSIIYASLRCEVQELAVVRLIISFFF